MKKPILIFLIVFQLSGGVCSSFNEGLSAAIPFSGSGANSPSLNELNKAKTTPVPDSASMQLVALGLIGLAGVSRKKKS